MEEGWKNLDSQRSNRSIWRQPRTQQSHWLSSSDPEDQPSQQHNTNLSFVGDISVFGVSRKKLLKVSQTVGNQVLFLMEPRWNFLLPDLPISDGGGSISGGVFQWLGLEDSSGRS